MPASKVNLRSFQKISRNMEFLIGKIERGGSRDAMKKAARPVLKAAKQNANASKRTGLLKRSLKAKTRTYVKDGQVVVIIGPDKNVKGTAEGGGKGWPAKYAHLVEHGTIHSAAQPFLRPALDNNGNEARRIYKREIKQSLKKIAKRFNKKAGF